MTALIRRHWMTVTGIVGALVLIFCFGFGVGQRWGASQWGPLAEWVAGLLTFAAVAVALRESMRGQRARRVDHEIARRRECLKALGDVWGALMQIGMDFEIHKQFLEDLPESFDATAPRPGRVDQETGEPLATEIIRRQVDFFTKWVQVVEPPLFVARALLQGTPMEPEVKKISGDLKKLTTEIMPAIGITTMSKTGRRPDTGPFDTTWKQLMGRRQQHLDLALEHFSLTLADVERAALRRR